MKIMRICKMCLAVKEPLKITIGILIFLFSLSACAFSANRQIQSSATMIGLSGNVEVMTSGGSSWANAKLRQSLDSGDRVKTGSKSGAVILLKDGTELKIGPLSNVTIDKIAGAQNSKSTIKLDSGKAWSRVSKSRNAREEQFTIKTPSSTSGVRGTEMAVEVDDAGATTLTVVEGEVAFGNEYGNVTVGTSQQSMAEPGRPPTPPTVVDTKHWVEWAYDIQAMGANIETPMTNLSLAELASRKSELQNKLMGQSETDYSKHLELASILFDSGELDAAAEEFVMCKDDNSTIWEAMYGLGMVYLSRGDNDAALEQFNALLSSADEFMKDNPDTDEDVLRPRAMADFGIGVAWLKANDHEKANEYFNKSVKFNAGSGMAYVGLAEVLIRQGKTDAAKADLLKALEINPGCYEALNRMALIEMSQNQADAALDSATKAVEKKPDSASANSTLARVRFFRSELGEARESADKALEIDPFNPAAHEVLARLYVLENKLKEASVEAMTGLAIDDKNPYLHDDLATVYYIYKKYDGAIVHWETAIELNPEFNKAKLSLAHLYNEMEETSLARKAETLANDVIKEKQDDDKAWTELGRALELQRKYPEAEKALLKAHSLAPQEALHLSRLASFYTDRHKIDLALDFAVKAVAAQPRNPWNHFILGRAYEAVDNLEGAKSAYLTAINLDPGFELARYQLGIIFTGEAKYVDALAELHTASLITPRVITLSEYRGPSRVYLSAGSFSTRYFEGVTTGSPNAYKLNYRLALTGSKTDGHRLINGGGKSNGGSFLVGYQNDADDSFMLYGDFSRTVQGLPGPATGNRANDPDDHDTFKSGRMDVSFRRRLSPKLIMDFRFGQGRTHDEYAETNDVDLVNITDYSSDKNNEMELRGDIRYSDATSIAFGGFSSKSDPKTFEWYEDIFGPMTTEDKAHYSQNSGYIQIQHEYDPKLKLVAGVESSFHNVAGSNLLSKYGFDYELNKRSKIHFINKETYRLSFFPQFSPRDEWTYLNDTDVTAPGTKSRMQELNYEMNLRDGSFIKVSAYQRKNREYDPNSDFRTLGEMTKQIGYHAEYERQITRKANCFVAVAHNKTRLTTPANHYYGRVIPYSPTDDYSVGLYFFPNSTVTVKFVLDGYGKRYSDFANTNEIKAFSLARLQLRYDPSIDESYIITIKNLFDKEYEIIKNYPEPGIAYEFSLVRWF